MERTASTESSLAAVLRRIYRVYRNQPLCLAHGLMRRVFEASIGPQQRVVLGNGLRMELDLRRIVQNTIFWLDGDVEPPLEWVVRELLPPGGNVVDCGANCGFIGLLARRVRGARVLFVEPHPRLAATVRRNIELNGWGDACRVVEAAASDTDGEIVLHENARLDGSHSVVPDWVDSQAIPGREIRVAARRLSSILASDPGFPHVDLLKIDTEGHDVAVLRGLGDWLAPGRVSVVYAEFGRDRDEGFQRLEAAGYAGYAARSLNRPAVNRLRRLQSRGAPVRFFESWPKDRPPAAETLWVPRDGPLAAFLDGLGPDGPGRAG